ncbi:MAG: ParB/RepB/Spo0J family partition protein [Candidatus Eisenbacteria bacterium]|uniref:ParB/RepB/Spo0J family partition protein n=1 Tax=Eiseniibacteriota bacterium TaxID=2212470 RepID=A0A849SCN9_UNCEI|nr:ParB/RepB/Spo0J family partition protein [Candidatus Eisenbacteria bacterium]
MPRNALGRGLEALIPGAGAQATATLPAPVESPATSTGEAIRSIPIDQIGSNPFQPRTRFNDDSLRELAESIKSSGIIQPMIVRQLEADSFELVAGERRLRAAALAGLKQVPVIVRTVDEREMMEMALIENVQREDLNPIDEAKGYQALMQKVGLTHDQLSERVGKQRSTITNSIRLLGLPTEVQDMVSRGTLSAGHGRALISLENAGDQLTSARYVSSKGFSVRRTEAFVARKLRRQHARPKAARSSGLTEWENKLQQRFSTHVAIVPGRKGGRIEFEYYGQEDLERLFEAWGVM